MKIVPTMLAVVLAAGLAAPVLAHDCDRPGMRHSAADVRHMQQRLNDLGYPVGSSDGVMGPKTHTAIRNFQRDEGLNATGEMNEETREALAEQSGSPTAGSR
ncbi:MAG TPA: peptidoglycan-binding domain-containing protein [Candidatus Binatia bacterium]|nr:peptidoglycan-binding domain-containing protein [Candidatus Binatia bacterium]